MTSITRTVDELYLERLRKAQRMPFAEKFLAGEELFDTACRWTKIGIKSDHPTATEAEVLELLKQRLKLIERMGQWRRERQRESR